MKKLNEIVGRKRVFDMLVGEFAKDDPMSWHVFKIHIWPTYYEMLEVLVRFADYEYLKPEDIKPLIEKATNMKWEDLRKDLEN